MLLPLVVGGIEIGNRHHGRKVSVTMVGPAHLAGALVLPGVRRMGPETIHKTPFRFVWTTTRSGTIQGVLSVCRRSGTRVSGSWGIPAPLTACTAPHRVGASHMNSPSVCRSARRARKRHRGSTESPYNFQRKLDLPRSRCRRGDHACPGDPIAVAVEDRLVGRRRIEITVI